MASRSMTNNSFTRSFSLNSSIDQDDDAGMFGDSDDEEAHFVSARDRRVPSKHTLSRSKPRRAYSATISAR